MTAQTAREILITKQVLPLTWAAICGDFHDKAIRGTIWESAKTGTVRGLERRIAFSDKNALAEVQSVLDAEWTAAGFDAVLVGEGDPSVYGEGATVAYLDQPHG